MVTPARNDTPITPPGTHAGGARPVQRAEEITETHTVLPRTYEQALDRDPRWALSEGSRHFNQQSQVFFALRKITKRLDELNIPYAVAGGMALFQHGLRRFTEDVDILVTRQDLKTIHEKLDGLGYLPTHKHGKNLRDTEFGVRIEFLITGGYPGDGKKQPVSFPDPAAVSVEIDGTKYINLANLVELKLASGMTGAGRRRDLADVLELIKLLGLPKDFAKQLDPYVGKTYADLWQESTRRYVTRWRNKGLTEKFATIDTMIAALRAATEHLAADELDSMRRDGVTLEYDGGSGDDRARLVTTDAEVAKKYDMVEEFEFWDQDEPDPQDPQ